MTTAPRPWRADEEETRPPARPVRQAPPLGVGDISAAPTQQHPLERMGWVTIGFKFGFGFAIGAAIAWPIIVVITVLALSVLGVAFR